MDRETIWSNVVGTGLDPRTLADSFSDYNDVTNAYEMALAEGSVTCAREYLWTLGEGRWSLVAGDEKYYLQVFLGGFSEEHHNHSKRILIRCWEFLDIEIHSGNGSYDAEPYLMLEGETGVIFRYGEICNPTDLSLFDGKAYLSNGGFRFGKGVELPKGITEGLVDEMIDEALEAYIPAGGAWRKIIDFNIKEDCSSVEFENDLEGNPIKASKLFAMITLAVPTDEAWKSERKFCASPYLTKDVEGGGGANLWHYGYVEVKPLTKYGATAPTHSALLMEIMGERMAIGQVWNSYNTTSLPDHMVWGANAFTLKTQALQHLKKPYANGFNMTSYQIVFPAGSRLQVWAVDYVGEV